MDTTQKGIRTKQRVIKNVVSLLQRQENGFGRCNYRRSLEILRNLVCDKDNKYRLVWSKDSDKSVMFDDKKLYFSDRSKCYYVWGKNGTPSPLYSLCDKKRYEDCIVYTSKINVTPLPRDDFANSFIGLTKNDNHLIRRDNLTGRLLNDIFLGFHYKFLQLNWHIQNECLLIQSTYEKKNGFTDKTILQAMAFFDVQPFKFKYMLELRKSVIGEEFKMANVSENIIILGGARGRVVMFSLIDLINLNERLCDCGLGQDCHRKHGPVGACVDGLPLTHDIEILPPILFEVRCFNQELFFGGFPWHYIFVPIRRNGIFKVMELGSDDETAEIDLSNETIHPDKCFFHWDESGRIVYESAHAAHIYSLKSDRDPVIKLDFTLAAGRELETPASPDKLSESTERNDSESSPRRSLRRASNLKKPYYSVEAFERTVFVLDYENELELLSILATSFDSDQGMVLIYDNLTGKLLKQVDLGITLKEVQTYKMSLDMDSIIVIEAKENWEECRKEIVYMYQLKRSDDEIHPTAKPCCSSPKKSRAAARSR